MRIAVLAHALRSGGGISVGTNIISSLGRVAPDNEYFITTPSRLKYENVTSHIPNCKVLVYEHSDGYINYLKRWLFDYRQLPTAIADWKADVILGLANMGLPGNRTIPQAILCHNPYLWYDQRHYGQNVRIPDHLIMFLQKRCFAKDVRYSRLLLCQTDTAINRINNVYGYAGKTAICPNAVSEFTIKEEYPQNIIESMVPYGNYTRLFYLTKYYTHKNIEVLVDMFERYRTELSSVVLFLTISKEQHPGAVKLLKTIVKKKLQDHIINIGPVPQKSLGAYFRNSDALMMPTLMESFSGSYLEAMHFGVPILTSDLDFARDVCGDAAEYFDPWDAETIKNAILKLKRDPQWGKDLVEKGKLRLQSHFRSWDQIVENILDNLKEIASIKDT